MKNFLIPISLGLSISIPNNFYSQDKLKNNSIQNETEYIIWNIKEDPNYLLHIEERYLDFSVRTYFTSDLKFISTLVYDLNKNGEYVNFNTDATDYFFSNMGNENFSNLLFNKEKFEIKTQSGSTISRKHLDELVQNAIKNIKR